MAILLLLGLARPALAVDIAFVDGGVDKLRTGRVDTQTVTITADTLTLYDASNNPLTTTNVSLTCNAGGTIGANGPDAAAVLGASKFVYIWAIHNGTTVASLASNSSARAGLTLPSGYTHARVLTWGYCNAASQLVDWRQWDVLREDRSSTPALAISEGLGGDTITITPTFGSPASFGAADANGTASSFARSDHVHKGVIEIGGYNGILANDTDATTQTRQVTLKPNYGLTANVSDTGAFKDAGSLALVARVDHTHRAVSSITAGTGITVTGGNAGRGDLTIAATASSSAQGNAIINGAMEVAQRGTSFAAVANGSYTLDRWRWSFVSGALVTTIAQSTDAPTYATASVTQTYSLKSTFTTGDNSVAATDVAYLRYVVEGYDLQRFLGGSMTLSWWTRASVTGTYCVSIRNGTDTHVYPIDYTINAANTWEQKTAIFPVSETAVGWNLTNLAGVYIYFPMMLGSNFNGSITAGQWTRDATKIGSSTATANACATNNNTFYITGVKLERGTGATQYLQQPYWAELARCQRYYWRFAPPVGVVTYQVYNSGGTQFGLPVFFPVTMRTAATITKSGTWGVSNTGEPANGGSTSEMFALVAITTALGNFFFYADSADDYFNCSAEF